MNNALFCFTGLLCVVIGIAVILLNCLIPEKIREAFSVGADEDDYNDMYSISEGYINTAFLGVSLEGVTVKRTNQEPQHISTLTVSLHVISKQAL